MADRITVLNEDTGLNVALVLDVIDRVTYSGTATVTRHPVERGQSIGDHVRPEPRPLEWSGALSELSPGGGIEGDRLQRLLDVLEELRTAPHLYTVTTPRAVYTTLHLTSYSATESTSLHGALEVSVKFETIPSTEARRVTVKLPRRAPDGTKGQSNDGKQVATAATEDAKRKSIAARLWDGDFNIFGDKKEE